MKFIYSKDNTYIINLDRTDYLFTKRSFGKTNDGGYGFNGKIGLYASFGEEDSCLFGEFDTVEEAMEWAKMNIPM